MEEEGERSVHGRGEETNEMMIGVISLYPGFGFSHLDSLQGIPP